MQTSIVIEDGTGSEVLTQMNNAFESLASNFTGGSEPTETYPGMIWMDTSQPNTVKKQRNTDNSGWIILGTFIDGVFYNADRAIIETYTINLGTTWTGTEAPYTQDVAVPGILATDNPIIGLLQSSSYETAQAQLQDYGKLYRAVTSADTVTFYAKESTSNSLTLQLKVIR